MLLKYITCLFKLNKGATCADQTGNAQTNLHTYCSYMSQETASHKLFFINYPLSFDLCVCFNSIKLCFRTKYENEIRKRFF